MQPSEAEPQGLRRSLASTWVQPKIGPKPCAIRAPDDSDRSLCAAVASSSCGRRTIISVLPHSECIGCGSKRVVMTLLTSYGLYLRCRDCDRSWWMPSSPNDHGLRQESDDVAGQATVNKPRPNVCSAP